MARRKQSKVIPNEQKVSEFHGYLEDATLRDRKQRVSFSRIFKEMRINTPGKGFTVDEMAAAYNQIFEPDDNDTAGCPNIESKRSIKGKIKYTTRKHNPYLEIYPTPVIDPNNRKRVHRYHITDDPEDTKKQTDPMFKVGNAIIDSANKRIQNQRLDPVQRMRKVDLRDELYDRDSDGEQ